ncbi:MAG: E3 binding domain-containing protein, partial [Geobacteraceae bacterium]|nr:E3 binding domain-containing protein [Geobacteraceae bacterium]
MATEITMPKLSDTMTEGRLISWKKGIGDHVERGEIIAEVETDKATMELEAFASGVLLETRVKPGDSAPVGTVIAVIGAAGEAVQTPAAQPAAEAPAPVEQAAPVAATAAAQPPAEEKAPPEAPPAPAEAGEEKASPLVRRLAREKGIDLAQIKGSGPEGRILQEDLEGFLRKQEEVKVEVEEKPGAFEPAKTAAEGAAQP